MPDGNAHESFGTMLKDDAEKLEKIAVAIVVGMTNINAELAEMASSRTSDKVKGATDLLFKIDMAKNIGQLGGKLGAKLGSKALSTMPEAMQDAADAMVSKVTEFGESLYEKVGGKIGNETLVAVSEAVASASSEMGLTAAVEAVSASIDAILSESGIGEILMALQGIGLLIDLWNPCGFGPVVYQDDLDKHQWVTNLRQRNYVLQNLTDRQIPGAPPVPVRPDYQPLHAKQGSALHTEMIEKFTDFMDKNGFTLSGEPASLEDIYLQTYTRTVEALAKVFPTYKAALLKHLDDMNAMERALPNSKVPVIIYFVSMFVILSGFLFTCYQLYSRNYSLPVLCGFVATLVLFVLGLLIMLL